MEKKEYQRLLNDAKQYAHMRYDLLKLELLEKLSRIIALLLVVVIALVLGLSAFVYFSLALAYALKPLFGGMGWPLCIMGLVFVLLLFLLFRKKEQFFLNPIISKLSAILFAQDATEEDEQPTADTPDQPTDVEPTVEE